MISKFGAAGFGYDIGIYRQIAIEYQNPRESAALPLFSFGAFSSLVLSVGDSLESWLFFWYFLLIFLSQAAFFVVIKKYTKSTPIALFALFLLSTSLVHQHFLFQFYYRNLLALFLLFGTLLLIEYKTFLALFPLSAVTAIHPLTAVVLLPTLFVKGLVQKSNRKFLWLLIGGSCALATVLAFEEFTRYTQTLFQFLQNEQTILSQSQELTGLFLPLFEFLRMNILILPLSLLGFFTTFKKYPFWSTLLAISLVAYICKLFLFERFLVFLNIALIFFAAVSLPTLQKFLHTKKLRYFSFICYTLCVAILFLSSAFSRGPLISPQELSEIRSFEQSIPENSFLLSWDTWYAPWLYGFSGNHKIIAPGMLHENRWSYEQWQTFWSDIPVQERLELLKQYETNDIYIFIGERFQLQATPRFIHDPHATKITPNLWHYQFSP